MCIFETLYTHNTESVVSISFFPNVQLHPVVDSHRGHLKRLFNEYAGATGGKGEWLRRQQAE